MKNLIGNSRFFLVIFLLVSFFSSTIFASSKTSFKQIVFFGDSLSDNGNLYRLFLKYFPKSPPYYQGRFSNGLVWTDIIATQFEKNFAISSTNYAYGGQTVLFHNPTDGYLPYTLSLSVDNYLLRSMGQDRGEVLFVIWIGANDYMNGATDTNQLTTDVTAKIKEVVDRLIYYGGKNFIIFNLPRLSKIPYSVLHHLEEYLDEIIGLHNQKLEAALLEIQNNNPTIHLELYDAHQLFDEIFETVLTQQQIELNTKEACWQGGYWLKNKMKLNEQIEEDISMQVFTNISFQKELTQYVAGSPDLQSAYLVQQQYMRGGLSCLFPDQYFFWDFVHPTKIIHQVMATMVGNFIDQRFEYAVNKAVV